MNSKFYRNGESFVIEGYNSVPPFADFFPGLADVGGKPMWIFYSNRGQCIASFGVNNKDGAMLEFLPANKAYQAVPILGFRTFFRKEGKNRNFYEPFAVHAKGALQTLVVRPYEVEIIDRNAELGLETSITYVGIPNENVPVFARCLRIKNLNHSSMSLQAVDGLPRITPYGMDDFLVKNMSRTIEAFAEVANLKEKVPFFRLKVEPHDRPDVRWLSEGFFSFSSENGALSPAVVDPSLIFGPDTAYLRPSPFIDNGRITTARQLTSNILPSCFYMFPVSLRAGESAARTSYFGFAHNVEEANQFSSRVSGDPDYFHRKREEMKNVYHDLTGRFGLRTGNDELNQYANVTFMDNTLRGGFPMSFGASGPILHVYSRKHGDMERDYNAFQIPATYYSQGNGNFRDVNQNRRSDLFLNPQIGTANIDFFFNLLQLDGYNPLIINASKFIVPKDMLAHLELRRTGECEADYHRLIKEPVSAGALYEFIKTYAVDPLNVNNQFMEIMQAARAVETVERGDGFWIDHWTYNLDHLDQYLAIFPEKKAWLFYEKKDFTFFDSDHYVKPRREKYVVTKEGQLRQYGAVGQNAQKRALMGARTADPHKARVDQGRGEVFTTNLFTKLVALAVVKVSTLDPFGAGIEMEADKPGWCDALNGCPGLFGSSTNEMSELLRLVRTMQAEVLPLAPNKTFDLPHEIYAFMRDVDAALASVTKDFRATWDRLASARENFREKTFFGISGKMRNTKMSDVRDFLSRAARVLEAAQRRAIDSKTGLPTTYFTYAVDRSDLDDGWRQHLDKLPWKQHRLPPFLEGVVHVLKLVPMSKAKKLYQAVKRSELSDKNLGMYRLNGSLEKESVEIGRIRIFSEGWLENASIFLHMHYKYLLEILRAGLVDSFFKEIRTGLIPFRDAETYGRPTFQNCSFLASSAFPDKASHGRGFVARLSGATSEFLTMVYHLVFGPRMFKVMEGNIVFAPEPTLPREWFARQDEGKLLKGSVSLRLFGVPVTFMNPKGKNTFGPGAVKPSAFEWILEGRFYESKGHHLTADASQALREGRLESLTVFLN